MNRAIAHSYAPTVPSTESEQSSENSPSATGASSSPDPENPESARGTLLHRMILTPARRVFGLEPTPPGAGVATLHGDEPEAPGLDPAETVQLRNIRRFGAAGALLMAIGALGAGAQPVLQNPIAGVRLLSLPSRMATSALTVTMTGTVVVVLAWLLLGRFALGRTRSGATPRRLSRSQMDRTLLLWILPLSVAPPMFSRDVYSYLAQSEITARGLDPYEIGPVDALGADNVLTRTVPNIWRETPAPYGPLFLWMGRGITYLTGENIVAGIFLHRLLALAGVALIVWALPRLARRCGVASVTALWLGAANPLLLFHLVAGIHNEALMIGLMLAGTELALRAIERPGALRSTDIAFLIGGAGVIALSSTIKIPSLIALGFVGMALSRRWGGTLRSVVYAALLLGTIAVAVQVAVSLGSGLGFGWIHTLGTAGCAQLDVDSHDSRPGYRIRRRAARPRRSHHRCVESHSADRSRRRRRHRDPHAGRCPEGPTALGGSAGGGAGSSGSAVPGSPALVPAVGGDPAGSMGHHSVLPASRHCLLVLGQRDPHAERQRIPAVPDRAGRSDDHPDHRRVVSADTEPAAVAHAQRTTGTRAAHRRIR